MSASIIAFPRKKRPAKAIVVMKVDDEWFTVAILPPGPRDKEMFGVFSDGVDFADLASAEACAVEAHEAFGQHQGLLLVNQARFDGGAA